MEDITLGHITTAFVTNRMSGERALRHMIFCAPLKGERADAICAMANTRGFVPCTAVARSLGIRPQCLSEAVRYCNAMQEPYALLPCERGHQGVSKPVAFFLVPRPPDYRNFGEAAVRARMEDVLALCRTYAVETLRMTPFCMLEAPRPLHHIRGVCRAIAAAPPGPFPKRIVFDLDVWRTHELYRVFEGEEIHR